MRGLSLIDITILAFWFIIIACFIHKADTDICARLDKVEKAITCIQHTPYKNMAVDTAK